MSARDDTAGLSSSGKLVATALSEVQKAIRFYRLYPPTHRFCQEAVAVTQKRLGGYLSAHGALELEVQREGMAVDDEVVLRESGQSTDLSSLLLPEGILGLTIRPGISDAEVSDFVHILSISYGEEGEGGGGGLALAPDLLSALWEREFDHIELQMQDLLAGSASTGDEALDAAKARIASLVNELLERHDVDAAISTHDADAELETLLKGRDEAGSLVPRADPAQAETFRVLASGAARAALVEEVAREAPDLVARGGEAVAWAARHAASTLSEDEMVQFLAGSALTALSKGDFDQAASNVSQLAFSRTQVGPGLTEKLGSPQCLRLVAQALTALASQGATKDALIDAGLRYLGRLDSTAVASACEIYPGLTQPDVRRVFRRFLSSRAGEASTSIEPLTRHAEEEIVKEAIGILAMGAKDSPSWALLRTIAEDDAHPVRQKLAGQVVGMVTGETKKLRYFAVLVEDADKKRRIAAAQQLRKVCQPGDRQIFDKLAELARRPDLGQRDPEELHAIFATLSFVGEVRAVPVLQELAKRRSLIFGRKEAQAVSHAALAFLASLKGSGHQ